MRIKEKQKLNKKMDEISSKYQKSEAQDPKVVPRNQDP